MGKQIRDILDSVPDKVFSRGEDYYNNDSILSLKRDKDLAFSGKVSGSSGDYKVKVQLSPSGEVLDYSCTCPYDVGDVCKHIVAVMLAIENHDFAEGMATGNEAGNPMDLERLLQDLPYERLMSIILSHAGSDEKFRTDLLLEIGPPDIRADLAVIKQKIDYVVSENSSRGFIEYDGCDAICEELSQCLDLAEERFESGLHMAAFEISLYLLLTGADLVSSDDSDSDCLAAFVEESIEALRKVCHQAAIHADSMDKEHCYDKLCKASLHKAFDGWSNWSQEILGVAVLLVSKQNQAGIFDALDALKARRTGEEHSDYAQTEEDLTRLKVIRKLEGNQAARTFIDSRLSSDRFRRMAVEEDIAEGDYVNAERLCRQKTDTPQDGSYRRVDEWWHTLYGIYEKTDNRSRLVETAKTLLLHGDLRYYPLLKALYQQNGEWGQVYPILRAELKNYLASHQYMQVLDWEEEHVLLFEEVKKQTKTVFQYGPVLARYYPETVYELYSTEIKRAAHEANNRGEYCRVCELLSKLYNAGGKEEALALTDEFTVMYKRRYAMIDELGSLRRRLK